MPYWAFTTGQAGKNSVGSDSFNISPIRPPLTHHPDHVRLSGNHMTCCSFWPGPSQSGLIWSTLDLSRPRLTFCSLVSMVSGLCGSILALLLELSLSPGWTRPRGTEETEEPSTCTSRSRGSLILRGRYYFSHSIPPLTHITSLYFPPHTIHSLSWVERSRHGSHLRQSWTCSATISNTPSVRLSMRVNWLSMEMLVRVERRMKGFGGCLQEERCEGGW